MIHSSIVRKRRVARLFRENQFCFIAFAVLAYASIGIIESRPSPLRAAEPNVNAVSEQAGTQASTNGESGIELDADRAFGYLQKICRIGRRSSGSDGMARQQKLIVEHFSRLGARVSFQEFDARHPLDGSPVRMANIVVSWHPELRDRVLLACHYDTRPFPDADQYSPQGIFIGANDGASGVALFMELGHHMTKIKPSCGVDFVFFDGEELVFNDQGKFFLGSEHFARKYRDDPPAHRYRCGVLVDMIGDKNLAVYKEKQSLKLAGNVTESVWKVARDLKVAEFIDRAKHEVNDDHLPLNNIAKIPTCDLIDFEYPYWHTTRDLPAQCSGESLVKVGRVLLKWLEDVPQPAN